MDKTLVTVVIELNGVFDEDRVQHIVYQMIAPKINHQETYNVVEIDVIKE